MRTIYKAIMAFAVVLILALFAPGTAFAAECGTPAKDAVFKTVSIPGAAEVSHVETVVVTPAVPEVPAVYEDVKVIDQAYVPAVPGTPEVPAVPEIPEVSHMETVVIHEAYDETVIDKEAYDETVPGQWWNWSPNKDQGPFEGPPAFPTDERGTWQGPHTEGGPKGEGTFQTGNGHGDWFHREADTVVHHDAETHVVHHDAVTEEVKVVDQPYVPGVPAIPAVPGTPAIEEVSHIEHRLVTPAVPAIPAVTREEKVVDKAAVPASSKKVLVSEAVPASEACAAPPASSPVETLAYTGSDARLPMLGGGLFLLGLLCIGLSRLKKGPLPR